MSAVPTAAGGLTAVFAFLGALEGADDGAQGFEDVAFAGFEDGAQGFEGAQGLDAAAAVPVMDKAAGIGATAETARPNAKKDLASVCLEVCAIVVFCEYSSEVLERDGVCD